MTSMFDDVVTFHQEILDVHPVMPTMRSQAWVEERFKFLMEEVGEFYTGCKQGNIVDAADALADTVYVALGTAYMMGLPWDAIWAAVQRANMAKVRGTTSRGNLIDAKKPEGWVGPEKEIAAAILKEIDDASDN